MCFESRLRSEKTECALPVLERRGAESDRLDDLPGVVADQRRRIELVSPGVRESRVDFERLIGVGLEEEGRGGARMVGRPASTALALARSVSGRIAVW